LANVKKYMFAIECSKPEAKNAMIGKKMIPILLMISIAAMLIQTVSTTIQLQAMPLAKACKNGRLIFPAAILTAFAPIVPSQRPVAYIKAATNAEPM